MLAYKMLRLLPRRQVYYITLWNSIVFTYVLYDLSGFTVHRFSTAIFAQIFYASRSATQMLCLLAKLLLIA